MNIPLKFIVIFKFCLYMCVNVSAMSEEARVECPGVTRGASCLVRVLGPELKSSVSTACALAAKSSL